MTNDPEALAKAYSNAHLRRARPCPFCGTEHLALTRGPEPQLSWQSNLRVFCPGCYARGPLASFAKHAVDRWNGNFLNAYRPSSPPDSDEAPGR